MSRGVRGVGIVGGALVALLAGCSGDLAAPLALDLAAPDAFDCNAWCRDNDPAHPLCADPPAGHRCVECLPLAQDGTQYCPSGQLCQPVGDSYRCSSRCENDGDCLWLAGAGYSCCGGACARLDRDPSHCGGCGQACAAVAHGDAACEGGHCRIDRCQPGFDDCDQRYDDGCEVPTATDPHNCGSCGSGCGPVRNAVPACVGGACVGACLPGFARCDPFDDEGCDVDTTGDAANCGGCGQACAAPAHAIAACRASACSFVCRLGFADCNGLAADGCEVAVDSDVTNCGHCGNLCPLRPHARAATCVGGQCQSQCQDGFGDCDGDPKNGCEADLRVDPQNCGSCGMACQGSPCESGSCFIVCWGPGGLLCRGPMNRFYCAYSRSDPKNCGACGNVCPKDRPGCKNGTCVAPYLPVGPQEGVAVTALDGWNECYRDGYSAFAGTLAQIEAQCSGQNLMLACRPAGKPTLSVLAWAPRADVLFSAGDWSRGDVCVKNRKDVRVHTANGTDWYFDGGFAWGFAAAGDDTTLCPCDTEDGQHPGRKLCWNTSGGVLVAGYRCGRDVSFKADFDRLIYQND